MAGKLKKSSEKKNAEAASSKAAQEDKDDVEEITINALEGVKANVEDTVENTIKEIILEYTNSGLGNVGQIMGKFNKEHKGKADNKLVSEIVKSILN